MNELRRMAYLEALGVDSYVSRTQLPGAAASRRLQIVAAPVATASAPSPANPATPETAGISIPWDILPGEPANTVPQAATNTAVSSALPTRAPRQIESVPRFSLAAIVAGDWLWLETLADSVLATEQVWLVKAMAQALASYAAYSDAEGAANGQLASVQTDVAQFDWPIHNNQQLDLGAEAARAGVAGFVGRKLQQHQCRGLILLGQPCEQWVPLEQLEVRSVTTLSSAQILARPELKQEAWRALLPLVKQ